MTRSLQLRILVIVQFVLGGLALLGGLAALASGAPGAGVAGVLTILMAAIVLGIATRLVRRGPTRWVETTLMVFFAFSILGVVGSALTSDSDLALRVVGLAFYGIGWHVVKQAIAEGQLAPVALRGGTAPGAGAGAAGAPPAPAQAPVVLLQAQGAVDAANGLGGWLAATGAPLAIVVQGIAPDDLQLAVADAAGTWHQLGGLDATGRAATQLPPGQWYLVVRDPHARGAAATLHVMAHPAAAAA